MRLRQPNYRAIAHKRGSLAGVFLHELRVDFTADDKDVEGHAELAGESFSIFLGLILSIASDGEGGFLELDEEVLFEDVAGEEECGSIVEEMTLGNCHADLW